MTRRARRQPPPDLTSLFDVLFIVIFAALIRAAAAQHERRRSRAPPPPPRPLIRRRCRRAPAPGRAAPDGDRARRRRRRVTTEPRQVDSLLEPSKCRSRRRAVLPRRHLRASCTRHDPTLDSRTSARHHRARRAPRRSAARALRGPAPRCRPLPARPARPRRDRGAMSLTSPLPKPSPRELDRIIAAGACHPRRLGGPRHSRRALPALRPRLGTRRRQGSGAGSGSGSGTRPRAASLPGARHGEGPRARGQAEHEGQSSPASAAGRRCRGHRRRAPGRLGRARGCARRGTRPVFVR